MTDRTSGESRRHFISRTVSLIVGASSLVACQDKNDGEQVAGQTMPAGIDKQMLDAVVDAIVPRDQDPGAVEAGVPEKLLELFHQKEDMKQHGLAMLDRVEVVAQHKFGRPFHQLSLAKREGIMHKTLHSRRKDDQAARQAISILRGYVIEAYYMSSVGQAMLGYTPPYPDGYPDYHAPPEV